MLVVSRRPQEKIVFPHLGITVQILRVSGRAVSVGIDAPRTVKILREELPDYEPAAAAPEDPKIRELRHALRNRMNAASLALHLVQRQLELGMNGEAEETIAQALEEFGKLDEEVGVSTTDRPALRPVRSRPRALLVEDDANESRLLAGYLQISGYEVHAVGDGQEALQFLAEEPRPDVVLLDMRMPRLGGPETVSSIRRRPELRDLKVFAVSGTPRAELEVTLGPGGVDRWFAKPLDPAKLVEALNRDLSTMRFSA